MIAHFHQRKEIIFTNMNLLKGCSNAAAVVSLISSGLSGITDHRDLVEEQCAASLLVPGHHIFLNFSLNFLFLWKMSKNESYVKSKYAV